MKFHPTLLAFFLCLSSTYLWGEPPHPDHVVLAYSASWRDEVSPPEFFDYSAVTHIARSFLQPHADGSVTAGPEFFNAELEKNARAQGVKLLMSVGGASDSSAHWVALATHPDALNRFCDQIGKLYTDHGYDGLDIDWEPAPLTADDGQAYALLMTTLRQKFPTKLLTAALPASDYWIGHTDFAKVTPALDYINVMTYDYSGGWGTIAAHGSNLYPPGAYPPQPEYSADAGIRNLVEQHHLPPQKLLLGLTFWGYQFAANHLGDPLDKTVAGYAENPSFAEVTSLLRAAPYREMWDESAAMPYIERIGGGSVISYENCASIRAKCEYAKSKNLAGMMIWHIGADQAGDQAPLLDAVKQSFGGKPHLLPRQAVEKEIVRLSAELKQTAPAEDSLDHLSDDALHQTYIRLSDQAAVAKDSAWRIKLAHPTTHP